MITGGQFSVVITSACVGDAAGATLEFLGRKPTADEVRWAMQMPGGGVWKVAPGQITDDGELTLAQARALCTSRQKFPLERIARNYVRWLESNPFDCGTTIAKAFSAIDLYAWEAGNQPQLYAETIHQAAAKRSQDSKANGSLMRATPLAVWGYRLEPAVLAEYARQDSALSHPNPSCCDAVACYVLAISSLILVPKDRQRAFTTAQQWAQAHANQEVQSWLQLALDGEKVPYHPLAGFIKIAFSHAFRQLLYGETYEAVLHETLLGGGDTDTNACIVGGLFGAYCGANEIPSELKEPVLTCDTTLGKHHRPEWLWASQLPELTRALLAPLEL